MKEEGKDKKQEKKNEIDPELIQFFEDHKDQYNFLLHRTKDKESALSIMENGLYFEEMLTKVTDPVLGAIEGSLIGNRIFFSPYGSYILIIAIPKEIDDQYDKIVEPVTKESLFKIFDEEEVQDFTDMYRLSRKYILGYNESFSKKLKFNKNFEK